MILFSYLLVFAFGIALGLGARQLLLEKEACFGVFELSPGEDLENPEIYNLYITVLDAYHIVNKSKIILYKR